MHRYEKFLGKEWTELLLPFLESEEYKKIGDYLRIERNKGVEITPDLSHLYRAFKECPLYSMHTIICGMDSYNNKTITGKLVADGIAFSSKDSIACPKSLNIIYEVIDNTIYNGEGTHLTESYDLKKWANQGILLINCGMTTVVGRAGAHIELWQPFITFLLETICKTKDNLGIMLMGKDARSNKKLITNETYKVLEVEYPIASSYKGRAWRHENIFKELTEWQQDTNNIKINW